MHDMLRIMDVASALRRQRETAAAQLDIASAKQQLRERLLATAAAAGEPVTPAEVDAAIEQYFARQHRYEDPPGGWKRFWAHVWVMRGALSLATGVLALATVGTMALAGVFRGAPEARLTAPPGAAVTKTPEVPAKPSAEANAAQVAEIWQRFQRGGVAATKLAADEDARERVRRAVSAGEVAEAAADLIRMREAERALAELVQRLEQEYTVRIVSRPREDSGVERLNAGRTSGLYVIVEAVTEQGKVLTRPIRHGEDGQVRETKKWGEQVSDAVWQRIVADKRADGVVDEAVFARKERGHYEETIVLDDGSGKPLRRGRQINQW